MPPVPFARSTSNEQTPKEDISISILHTYVPTTCRFGTKVLFSSVTLRNLLRCHWCSSAGGIGKYRQIVGALCPHGEHVKTPVRSSQLGRLR